MGFLQNMLENGHSNLQTKFGVHITSIIFKIFQLKTVVEEVTLVFLSSHIKILFARHYDIAFYKIILLIQICILRKFGYISARW